jgi:hypothetical protein
VPAEQSEPMNVKVGFDTGPLAGRLRASSRLPLAK